MSHKPLSESSLCYQKNLVEGGVMIAGVAPK